MKNSRKNKKWMHLIALAIFVGIVACSMFMSSAATRTYNISSGTKFKHQIMVNSGNAFTATDSTGELKFKESSTTAEKADAKYNGCYFFELTQSTSDKHVYSYRKYIPRRSTTTASWSHYTRQKYGYMFAATGNPNSTSKDSEYFKLSGYFRY